MKTNDINGANINYQDHYRITALHQAATWGRLNVVNYLLTNNANVNPQNDLGETPLLVAVTHNQLDIVNALINAGANVNLTNSDNETPLFIAVANDHLDIVNILIGANADVNIRDVQGETPLSTAALLGELEVVKILLEAGADMNEKNNNGETALDLAKQLKHNDVEKKWGNLITEQTNNNQWTTKLGETILKEILLVQKGDVWRPKQLDGHKPDWETEDGIYEVKTRNWTTSGTAGEKILGTPFKYADIPVLYKKPLYIVTIAYQEYEACSKFELFNSRNPRKIKMIEQWKEMGIEYIKCSDLLEKN